MGSSEIVESSYSETYQSQFETSGASIDSESNESSRLTESENEGEESSNVSSENQSDSYN